MKNSWWRDWRDPRRRGQVTRQFLKYLAGGSLYFWSAYAIFAICFSVLHWSWFPAKVLSDIVGWSLNYVVQRFWAFSDQHHLSEMEHAGRYVFIESIGFVMDYLLIGGLYHVGVSPYIGFLISGVFFTVWSWLWYRYWVFPEPKPKSIDNQQMPNSKRLTNSKWQ